MIASLKGHIHVAKLLCDGGAKIDSKNDDGCAPLFIAAQNGQFEVVQLLLQCGADVNAKEKNGWTPLHISCFKSHSKIVTLLLDHEADCKVATNDGSTPLHLASQQGNREIFERILKRVGEDKPQILYSFHSKQSASSRVKYTRSESENETTDVDVLRKNPSNDHCDEDRCDDEKPNISQSSQKSQLDVRSCEQNELGKLFSYCSF